MPSFNFEFKMGGGGTPRISLQGVAQILKLVAQISTNLAQFVGNVSC